MSNYSKTCSSFSATVSSSLFYKFSFLLSLKRFNEWYIYNKHNVIFYFLWEKVVHYTISPVCLHFRVRPLYVWYTDTNIILYSILFMYRYIEYLRSTLIVSTRTFSYHWFILKLSYLIANFTMKNTYSKVTAEFE